MKEQTAMPELPLCPFCGGKPILNHIEAHTHHLTFNGQPIMSDYPGSWTIECCDVGMIKDTREEVIAAWSRRAAPPAQAQPSRQVLNEFIEKFCLGKPELIATAQSAFYAFTQLAPNQEAAHAVGVERGIAHAEASEALDALDDYARMDVGVDAIGPRGVLEKYIEQQTKKGQP